MSGKGLQVVPVQVKKVIQLYETMLVRHGVMLVGPTGGGKTTVYKVRSQPLTVALSTGLCKIRKIQTNLR